MKTTNKLLIVLTMCLFSSLIICTAAADTSNIQINSVPTITTDKADYYPTETVNIEGSGFLPNHAVYLKLSGPSGFTDYFWTSEANSSGNLATSYSAGLKAGNFVLTATDGINKATTTFSDFALEDFTINPSSWQVPNPFTAPASQTFTVTAILPGGSGEKGVNVYLTPAPNTTDPLTYRDDSQGITIQYAKNPLPIPPNSRSASTTMTITIAPTSFKGQLTLPIGAYDNPGGGGNIQIGNFSITLHINQLKIAVNASPTEISAADFLATYTATGTIHTAEQKTTPCEIYIDGGTSISLSGAETPITVASTEYVLAGYSKTFPYTPTSDVAITLNYNSGYYQVNFTQSGSAVNPTITYQIGGSTAVTNTVPFSVWVASGSTVTYTYQDNIPGATGTKYVLTSTPNPNTQTITGPTTITGNYGTSYHVTYTSSPANLNVPLDQWIFSGSSATGAFEATQYNAGSTVKFDFASDDRPSAITAPTIITGTYTTSYKVTYVSSPTGLSVPVDEWVLSGGSAIGTFDATQYNMASTIKFDFVYDDKPSVIASSTIVTGTYSTSYKITTVATPLAAGSTNPSESIWAPAGSLTISATNNAGYRFTEWTSTSQIDIASSSSASTTATISGPGTITANFQYSQAISFEVTTITSTTAGTAFSATVTALDSQGNIAIGYGGIIHITTSDVKAVLPADATLNNGVGHFIIILKTAGNQIITATDVDNQDINGHTTIKVNARFNAPGALLVSPLQAIAYSGDTVPFTAELFDVYGNSLGDVTSVVTWSIDTAAGGSWELSTGNYKTAIVSPEGAPWTVTAKKDSLTTTAKLTVNQAINPSYIIAAPKEATVLAGATQTYTATAYDEFGNTWNITETAKYTCPSSTVIISGNRAYSNTAGVYEITVTYNGKTDTAKLTVTANPNLLDHIVVSPKTATVSADGSQTYSTTAYDIHGNGWLVQATYSASTDAKVNGNIVSSTKPGSYTITATYNGKMDTATLTVTAGAVDHIAITPKSASISTGSQQAFTVTAYDLIGNSWDVTAQATFAAPGATISGNKISGSSAGTYTITATYSGKTDTATLTITAPSTNTNTNSNTNTNTTPKPTQYTITFTENGLPASTTWTLTFNGQTKSSTTTTITFTVPAGSYKWTVESPITNNSTRYIADYTDVTTTVSSTTSKEIQFTTQFYLDIQSPYGNPTGEGWYDKEATAEFSVTSPASTDSGAQWLFRSWAGTGEGAYNGENTQAATVTMSGPITETANWDQVTSLWLYLLAVLLILGLLLILLAWRRKKKKQEETTNQQAAKR